MMPEQQDLLVQARDSLEAAKLLRTGGYVGFAAARAYYAMFYVAEALLLGKDLAFSKHSAVHSAFGLHFCKTGLVPLQFQNYLATGMEARHSGDYGKGKAVTREDLDKHIAHAEEFLAVAARLVGPLPPEEAGSA